MVLSLSSSYAWRTSSGCSATLRRCVKMLEIRCEPSEVTSADAAGPGAPPPPADAPLAAGPPSPVALVAAPVSADVAPPALSSGPTLSSRATAFLRPRPRPDVAAAAALAAAAAATSARTLLMVVVYRSACPLVISTSLRMWRLATSWPATSVLRRRRIKGASSARMRSACSASVSLPPSSSPSSPPAPASAAPPRPRSRSSPQPAPSSCASSSSPAAAAAAAAPLPLAASIALPLAASVSKKPLDTVSSGQLSSLRMGVGGMSSEEEAGRSGRSGSACPSRSASSSSPCTDAATYASGAWPASSRMRTCSRTSPRYSAFWKRPITSPRISAILSILRSFSRLPVMRYRKDRRSNDLVFWYENSTIWWLPWRSASTPSLYHVSLSSSSCALCSATSMLPHCTARLKRVRSSFTKCSATSGKPFCCR
mmetsp:Transcript_30277/g.77204  ORF Transcript_30277/g.77204 Transcript_30277/m.77204 type:complete len:426 (-) Transcript_30277:1985-3262(-)